MNYCLCFAEKNKKNQCLQIQVQLLDCSATQDGDTQALHKMDCSTTQDVCVFVLRVLLSVYMCLCVVYVCLCVQAWTLTS